MVGVVVFQLLQSIASLFLPTLNAQIIDRGEAKGDTAFILSTGEVMLVITLVQVVCAITAVYFGAKVAMAVGRDLRSGVFMKVSDFSEREVSFFGAPSLITRTTSDVQQVQMLVLMGCTLLVSASMLCVGGIIMAISLDTELSWLIVAALPVLVGLLSLIIVRMVPLFCFMQKRIDMLNGVLREQLTGIRVIRAFVREDAERLRFGRANIDVTQTALGAGRLFALMFPVVTLVLNVSPVAVLWFGAFRVADGSTQIGTLVALLTYMVQFLMAVMMATFMAILIPRAAVCADRIAEVLDTESSVIAPTDPISELFQAGVIELKDVFSATRAPSGPC
jgi:ATP-binding cassette subfamily B multidrug efflux pump